MTKLLTTKLKQLPNETKINIMFGFEKQNITSNKVIKNGPIRRSNSGIQKS